MRYVRAHMHYIHTSHTHPHPHPRREEYQYLRAEVARRLVDRLEVGAVGIVESVGRTETVKCCS